MIVLTDFENDTAGVCYQTVIYVKCCQNFSIENRNLLACLKTEKSKIIWTVLYYFLLIATSMYMEHVLLNLHNIIKNLLSMEISN